MNSVKNVSSLSTQNIIKRNVYIIMNYHVLAYK